MVKGSKARKSRLTHALSFDIEEPLLPIALGGLLAADHNTEEPCYCRSTILQYLCCLVFNHWSGSADGTTSRRNPSTVMEFAMSSAFALVSSSSNDFMPLSYFQSLNGNISFDRETLGATADIYLSIRRRYNFLRLVHG